MGRVQFHVNETHEGQRLDKVLASHPDILTRSRAEKLIGEKRVSLSGKFLKASYRCRSGEVYEIEWPAPEPTTLVPWDFPLEIVFEDECLLVINKPSNMVVHPSLGHSQRTLVNALLAHTETLSMGFNERRPGIVHRLDKETSGLLVVAKTNEAHAHLSAQFKARTVHRIYWALVFGRPSKTQGSVESFLARHPTNRKRFASGSQGKRAVTHYKMLANHKGLSLLECRLETGRTHQIRVHMSELGHPLVGDSLYGSGSRAKNLSSLSLRNAISDLNRIGLHACELGFVHPLSGRKLSWSVGWPENLKDIVRLLEIRNDL